MASSADGEREGLEREIARLNATLQSIGEAVISVDAGGTILQLNHSAEVLTGWRQGEAAGQPFAKVVRIVDEVTHAPVECSLTRVLREGMSVDFANDNLLIARDGTERFVADNGAPVHNEQGDVTGVVLVLRDQTGERAAHKALRENERKFRDIVSHLDEGYYRCSMDGVLFEHNAEFNRVLGFPADQDLKGFNLPDFWQIPEERKAYLIELQSRGIVRSYLINAKRISGDKVVLMANAHLVKDEKGNCVGIEGTLTGFTERKRAERALQASETRYRRLFEAAKDGILILDADTGKIVDVNPFLMELTGYSHDDFMGRHLWEIGAFKDIAASKDSFADLQANRYVRYEDLPLLARDGRKLAVEFVSNVYRVDEQNEIQCNIRDISARKRAEDELRFRNLILATQQEASIDGILVVDVNGKIVSSNRRFADLWRIPLDVIESKSHERALESVLDTVANREEFLGRVNYLYAHRDEIGRDEIALKDGRTFDRYSAPMLGADGKYFGRVWYFRDITARRQAEAEREKLEGQFRVSQKMEAIGSLAGGVAHDFNNLLCVILSYTGFAMEAAGEGSTFKDDLAEVQKAAERAAALTRQLLAFSRKQVLQPVPLNLNAIARGLEKMLRRILGEDIDFMQVLAPDLGVVEADPGQIEQVLMNLVVNARDAMPEGGKLTIETANVEIDEAYAAQHVAVKPGSYVQLVVTDTGCGMDEQTRAHIFEPFFTTKEKGRGTGLGLSTAYGIVKQSGGNIWVYSEPGQGTTFKVYLPRELSGSTAAMLKAPAPTPKRTTGHETILVVEDEAALRKVATRTLEAAGYTVVTAANGEEALQASAQHARDIDLLLTDVIMPQMSGKTLAQSLCKLRPTLKVLYMSGYTGDAIVHHGVLDAGTHFLAKPFTASDLTLKVREVLDSPQ